MKINEHLKQAVTKEGTHCDIEFSLQDHTPMSASTGWVPDGKYQLRIRECTAKPNPKQENMFFAEVNAVIEAPERYAGTLIKGSFVIATSLDPDKDIKKTVQFNGNFLYSVLSAQGEEGKKKYEEFKKVEKFKINTANFEGKTVYCTTETQVGKDKKKKFSEAQYWISKEEYELRPGPIGAIDDASLQVTPATGTEIMDPGGTGDDALAAAMGGTGSNGAAVSTGTGFTI